MKVGGGCNLQVSEAAISLDNLKFPDAFVDGRSQIAMWRNLERNISDWRSL
jgi:hypothetical protein